MKKKILIIKGDPRKEGYMKKMAAIYEREMLKAEFDVKVVDLRTLDYDAKLSEGYDTIRSEAFLEVRDYFHEANLVFFLSNLDGQYPSCIKRFC